jgi:hypothetical protein
MDALSWVAFEDELEKVAFKLDPKMLAFAKKHKIPIAAFLAGIYLSSKGLGARRRRKTRTYAPPTLPRGAEEF